MTNAGGPIALQIAETLTGDALGEQARSAINAGFDGIELAADAARLGTAHTSGLPASPSAEPQNVGVGDGCEDLHVVAIAAKVTSTDLDTGREELTAHLASAAGLRARCLNLTLPPLAAMGDAAGFARYQDALNFGYALFQRSRLDVEASGVAVGVEAAAGGCFLSPVELREFIDAVGCWAVGACVDVRRIARIGSTADWLQTLGSRVQAIRLHDSVTQDPKLSDWSANDRPVIMAGNRPATELRDLLTKQGFRAPGA